MSDSESSESEVSDIEWSPQDMEELQSQYEDSDYTCPQISAVIEDDLARLRVLVRSGQSVNIKDRAGNTPLHVAIIRNNRRIFNFLVNRRDIHLDIANFTQITPLMLALIYQHEDFARCLIGKKVNVNSKRTKGDTALHYAMRNGVPLTQLMVENGANVDERNCVGETPLYIACANGNNPMVDMLLFYGADATITCRENVLPLSHAMDTCDLEIQEVLFEYTFGEDSVEVGLRNFGLAMASKSPIFYKMIEKTSEIVFDDERVDFHWFAKEMSCFAPEMFRVFIKKFEYVLEELFAFCNPLMHFFRFLNFPSRAKPDFAEIIYILCESPFFQDAMSMYVPEICVTEALMEQEVSEDTLTKVVCCLMSCGIPISAQDLNVVYEHFGYCNLLRIMLHMEVIGSQNHKEQDDIERYLMPILTYDLNLKFDDIKPDWFRDFDSKCLEQLARLFVLPRGKFEDRLKDREDLPQVPSLVQLSRDAARNHIIETFKVKKPTQFYTILQGLPIARVYKQILSYERNIY